MTLSAWTRGHEPMTGLRRAVLAVGALAAASPVLQARPAATAQLEEPKQLSIAQLAHVEVTSVTRAPQPLSQSAAAVAVVTSGEIARSGANNIPGAIRYVPGLDVAAGDDKRMARQLARLREHQLPGSPRTRSPANARSS
ncbi:MAG TPA: hypothetical protein VFN79_05245 [Steroidobacteraceae bacterium]|nr:hypothetical protein [Steroidobacteraceae bacterium]